MQNNIFKPGLCCLLLVLSSFTCSKNASTQGPLPAKASSFAPAVPLLKGVAANPYIRIAVQIFSGNSEQQYRKIQCTINDVGLDEVQKQRCIYPAKHLLP